MNCRCYSVDEVILIISRRIYYEAEDFRLLEAHKSEQPSTFTEDAKWRQEVVQTSPTNLV